MQRGGEPWVAGWTGSEILVGVARNDTVKLRPKAL